MIGSELCWSFVMRRVAAVREGFSTYVLVEGCRGVELQTGDVDRSMDVMRNAGAWILGTSDSPG